MPMASRLPMAPRPPGLSHTEAAWNWSEEPRAAAAEDVIWKNSGGSASSGHWLAPEPEDEDPHLLAYEASHMAAKNEASIYAAFVAGEIQRLEGRLEEWLHELDTCLAGYTQTWTQTLAAPRHVVHPKPQQREESPRQTSRQRSQPHQQQQQQQHQQKEQQQQDGQKEGAASNPAGCRPPASKSSQRPNEQPGTARRSSKKKEDYNQELRALADFMTVHRGHRSGIVGKVVLHPYFDNFIIFVVAANSLLIGAQVQHASSSDDPSFVLSLIEYVCSAIFTLELFLHMYVHGIPVLCHKKQRKAFIFDICLVGLSWFDMLMSALASGDSMSLAKMLRIVRMTKVLRLLRVVNKLGELRVMAMMIVHSLQSLFWLFWLLVLLLYIAATILTQGATEYLRFGAGLGADQGDDVQEAYGSLFRTMYTLFLAMSGGVSWGEVAAPMARVHTAFFVIFLIYIFFTLFSVLNIVTGVFVDSAIQAAQRDRGVLMEKQRQAALSTKQHVLSLLEEIDTDKTGIISRDELTQSLESDNVKDYFNALSIDTDNVAQLMDLLDADGDGAIDISEFVDGCQRLKGEAKSFDIHMLMMQNRQVLKTMLDYMASKGFLSSDSTAHALQSSSTGQLSSG